MNVSKICAIAVLLLSFFILTESVLASPPYSGGSGTAGDPYRIGSAANLLYLGTHTGDYDAYFILTADINLASYDFTTAVIAPDGNNANTSFEGIAFTGVFDGNGYTISNLTIDTGGAGNDYLGLFGRASGGEIKNLGLENVSITGGDTSLYVGGLVGYNDGSGVSNCHSTGTVSGGDNSGYLGGLLGINGGDISNCYSTGTVTGGSTSTFLGGLVGWNRGADHIFNCHSTSNVNGGDNSYYLGGLAGVNSGYISYCYSTGAVMGEGGVWYLGGLAGYNGGYIIDCYSTSTIVGGFDSIYLGGLAGVNWDGNISDCYSTGAVRGGRTSTFLGGLAGANDSGGSISGCYFLNGSGPDNDLGEPLTNAKMKQQKSFVGWDFVGETANGFHDTWWIAEGVSYPKLYWQLLEVAKCTVTAGSKDSSGKIFFSGQMYAAIVDFNDANNIIKVTISSDDIVSPCALTFPIDANTFKKGKYSYSKTVSGVRKSFTYDVKTHKFAFAASNVGLSGLDCPVTIEIEVGDYYTMVEIDEVIVNGPKVPIPIKLMMGVKDVLRVDKCTVKQNNKKSNSDQLTASGGFAVENPDPCMANWTTEDLVITLGTQFTIPAGSLKAGKGKFTCSKAEVTEAGGGTADATFNFNMCSFTLTIKKMETAAGSGIVDFGVAFAGFNEVDQVTLP